MMGQMMNDKEKKMIETVKSVKYGRTSYREAKRLFDKKFQRHTWVKLYPRLVDLRANDFVARMQWAIKENEEAKLAGVTDRFTRYDVVRLVMAQLSGIKNGNPNEFAKLKTAIFKD